MLGAAFVALVLGAGGLAVALYHYYRCLSFLLILTKNSKLKEGGQGAVPQPEGGPAVRVCEDQAGGGGGGDAPIFMMISEINTTLHR